jgi:hypothetical protein
VALGQQAQDVISQFSLQAGATATFVLGTIRPQGEPPEMGVVGERFQETSRFWKAWIAKSKYKGRWREMVNRSALILKLLISQEHGSLIAAPTMVETKDLAMDMVRIILAKYRDETNDDQCATRERNS